MADHEPPRLPRSHGAPEATEEIEAAEELEASFKFGERKWHGLWPKPEPDPEPVVSGGVIALAVPLIALLGYHFAVQVPEDKNLGEVILLFASFLVPYLLSETLKGVDDAPQRLSTFWRRFWIGYCLCALVYLLIFCDFNPRKHGGVSRRTPWKAFSEWVVDWPMLREERPYSPSPQEDRLRN